MSPEGCVEKPPPRTDPTPPFQSLDTGVLELPGNIDVQSKW